MDTRTETQLVTLLLTLWQASLEAKYACGPVVNLEDDHYDDLDELDDQDDDDQHDDDD